MSLLDTAPHPDRTRRLAPLIAGTAVVALLTVALHFRDPHQGGSWGVCPWLVLTGTPCPGCGGLRAVNNLTNGDIAAAASSNLLFVASLPLLAWLWLRAWVRGWRGDPRPARTIWTTRVWPALFVVVVLAFGIVRNTGFGAWLAP